MRARYFLTLMILTLVLLVIPHIQPTKETYLGMSVQEVAGRPHLLLQEDETFSIYVPVGDTSLQGWKPLFDSRLGKVLGTYEVPKSDGRSPALGLFFEQRFSALDIEPGGKNSTAALPLGVEWLPETAAELDGALYCFGRYFDPARRDDEHYDGVLKAARFKDNAWSEIPTAALNDFRYGGVGVARDKRAGFWLHALPLNGRLAVIWRSMEYSQTLGMQVEGPRYTGEGDTWISYFDGEKFSPRVDVKNLPAGNGCVWVENGKLNFLVQTRANKLHTGNPPNGAGRVEIWNVGEDGTAALQETVASGKSRLGLINFIAAQRFKYAGAEHVIRSTWQRFEVVRKDADNAWSPVPNGAAGLPVFSLERWLYAALGLCALIIVFGAWLAFKRRRQAFAVLQKVRPDELLAPLSLRASACLLDWAVVLGATWLAARFDSEHFIDILPSPTDLPYTPFMLCSLAYFVFFERCFGATPGKLAMGLCVVTDNAKWPDLRAVLVRNVAGLYERHPLCLLIAAPMLLFSPRRQRIGDLLSRTVVVQRRGLERLWATQAAESKTAQPPDDSLLESNDRKESR